MEDNQQNNDNQISTKGRKKKYLTEEERQMAKRKQRSEWKKKHRNEINEHYRTKYYPNNKELVQLGHLRYRQKIENTKQKERSLENVNLNGGE